VILAQVTDSDLGMNVPEDIDQVDSLERGIFTDIVDVLGVVVEHGFEFLDDECRASWNFDCKVDLIFEGIRWSAVGNNHTNTAGTAVADKLADLGKGNLAGGNGGVHRDFVHLVRHFEGECTTSLPARFVEVVLAFWNIEEVDIVTVELDSWNIETVAVVAWAVAFHRGAPIVILVVEPGDVLRDLLQ
jgi:hypothetical protein